MRQQIRRFNVAQTAKVAGALYLIAGVMMMALVFGDSVLDSTEGGLNVGFTLFLPLLYAVGGYFGTALGCAIYNWLAGRIGGIEFELEPVAQGT